MKKSASAIYNEMYGHTKEIRPMSQDQFNEMINVLPDDIKARIILPENRQSDVDNKK